MLDIQRIQFHWNLCSKIAGSFVDRDGNVYGIKLHRIEWANYERMQPCHATKRMQIRMHCISVRYVCVSVRLARILKSFCMLLPLALHFSISIFLAIVVAIVSSKSDANQKTS